MKTALLVGGPLILFLGFSFWSDAITYGDQSPGMIHFGGAAVVQQDTYMCDENGGNCVLVDSTTEVTTVEPEAIAQAGVSQSANYRIEESSTGFADVNNLEIEDQSIEYREGSEPTTMQKQPGITKYANISVQRPTGFDLKGWKFIFEREAALDEVRADFEEN